MEKNLPKRKNIRLKNYDYSSKGLYYITICTENRKNLFWENSGKKITSPNEVILSGYGILAQKAIQKIEEIYPEIKIDCYVIMPNHIHLLLQVKEENKISIQRVISQFKGYVSKNAGGTIWQKLFYDHIIRNETDYLEIVRYIYENPMKWQLDKLYGTFL